MFGINFMIFLWPNIILIVASIFAISFVNKIPRNILIYDKPDNSRKIHSIPTPLFVGIIFYVNVCLNLIFFYKYLFNSEFATFYCFLIITFVLFSLLESI